jgi:hypothetical protein
MKKQLMHEELKPLGILKMNQNLKKKCSDPKTPHDGEFFIAGMCL